MIEYTIFLISTVAISSLAAAGLIWLFDQLSQRRTRLQAERLASLRADEESADAQIQAWRDHAALDGIAMLLDRREWTVDDLDTIADLVRGTGRAIGDCWLDSSDNGAADPPSSTAS